MNGFWAHQKYLKEWCFKWENTWMWWGHQKHWVAGQLVSTCVFLESLQSCLGRFQTFHSSEGCKFVSLGGSKPSSCVSVAEARVCLCLSIDGFGRSSSSQTDRGNFGKSLTSALEDNHSLFIKFIKLTFNQLLKSCQTVWVPSSWLILVYNLHQGFVGSMLMLLSLRKRRIKVRSPHRQPQHD